MDRNKSAGQDNSSRGLSLRQSPERFPAVEVSSLSAVALSSTLGLSGVVLASPEACREAHPTGIRPHYASMEKGNGDHKKGPEEPQLNSRQLR
jgi:hypothetical protein